MAWWDYGYQIRQPADRAVLVDPSGHNTTHVATVAKVLLGSEADAAAYMKVGALFVT